MGCEDFAGPNWGLTHMELKTCPITKGRRAQAGDGEQLPPSRKVPSSLLLKMVNIWVEYKKVLKLHIPFHPCPSLEHLHWNHYPKPQEVLMRLNFLSMRNYFGIRIDDTKQQDQELMPRNGFGINMLYLATAEIPKTSKKYRFLREFTHPEWGPVTMV